MARMNDSFLTLQGQGEIFCFASAFHLLAGYQLLWGISPSLKRLLISAMIPGRSVMVSIM